MSVNLTVSDPIQIVEYHDHVLRKLISQMNQISSSNFFEIEQRAFNTPFEVGVVPMTRIKGTPPSLSEVKCFHQSPRSPILEGPSEALHMRASYRLRRVCFAP